MAQTFGDYNLIQKIAQGGMAEIFLATREGDLGGFEKQLAIKRIFRHLTGREETVNMFFDEARIAATLNHPNIVQIFDLGEVDEHFYIAMEFVHGTDLRRVCKKGLERDDYLPIELAARIVADTAGGLHYAHTRTDESGGPRNIVHRDISPQNILLSMEGYVKVCDFGIAKAENRLARTRTGQFKGKLSYMSPEQFNGENVDARSDIFNLGIVLYEITLARRLFNAKTDFERMRQIANAQVTRPTEIQPDFPPHLEHIIMKALRHDPAERFQTAEAMQVELEQWLHDQGARVGAVEIGSYMKEIFPDLAGGPPQDMSQVEFPAEGRESSRPSSPGGRPPGQDSSGPEVDRSNEGSSGQPTPTIEESGAQALEDEATAEVDASNFGGVTVDPNQQRDQRPGPGATTEKNVPQSADQNQQDEAAGYVPQSVREAGGEMTEEIDVDREELEQAVRDHQASFGEQTDATQPTPIRQGKGPESDGSGAQESQRSRRDSADMTGGPRHESSTYPSEGQQGSAPMGGGSSQPAGGQKSHPQNSPAPGNQNRPPQGAGQPGGPGAGGASQQGGGPGRGHQSGPPADSSSGPPSAAGGAGSGGGERVQADRSITDDFEQDKSFSQTLQHSIEQLSSENRRGTMVAMGVAAVGLVGLGVFLYSALDAKTDLSGANIEEKPALGDVSIDKEKPSVERVAVEIATEPEGAQIIANGLSTGETTPATVDLVAGQKNELFLYKPDYQPERLIVDGAKGAVGSPVELTEVESEADRGSVKITSDPKGAKVFLDGSNVGKTPLTVEGVPAGGYHHLEVRKEGKHPYFLMFENSAGTTTPVSINLANSAGPEDDDYCEVIYDFAPSGAMVQVNGESEGAARVAVRHTCGEYLDIACWRSNYEDGNHHLLLDSPGTYRLSTSLEKIIRAKGTLNVEVPDDIRVYIGSNAYGKGAVEDLELPEGEYTAVFERSRSERYEHRLKVRPGTSTTYRVRFEGGDSELERVAN